MARLKVKVVPGSSRDQIVGWLGDALKIKIPAPPEKGKANEAVIEFLAERLGIDADAIQIESGHSLPSKIVAIKGMDDGAINTTTLAQLESTRASSSSIGRLQMGQ